MLTHTPVDIEYAHFVIQRVNYNLSETLFELNALLGKWTVFLLGPQRIINSILIESLQQFAIWNSNWNKSNRIRICVKQKLRRGNAVGHGRYRIILHWFRTERRALILRWVGRTWKYHYVTSFIIISDIHIVGSNGALYRVYRLNSASHAFICTA